MKFVMEFDVDNAFFHSEPYYNSKQKKETLNLTEVGYVVCGIGNKIANGQMFGSVMDANGNGVWLFNMIGR